MRKIVVVGAGPAGMMAAICAAKNPDNRVVVFEQNEKPGKKLYITGKGRGNFTNACDIDHFLEGIHSNPRFLYASLHKFSNVDLLSFMKENGLSWKVERGQRVFPVSDHASDITKALVKAMDASGIEILLNTRVAGIEISEEEGEKPCVKGVKLFDGSMYPCDALIVATGGLSYESTGARGDGYVFARRLNIEVKDPVPALVPLEVFEADICRLQGLSLKNVSMYLFADGKKRYEGFGELLFTHFGISGPLTLQASLKLADELAKDSQIKGFIDLKPAVLEKDLDARLIGLIKKHRKKEFSHFFDELAPAKLCPVLVERSSLNPKKRVGDISKEERKKILCLLKSFSFTVKGTRGFSEAIITHGGVSVKELTPSGMRSKKIDGLSFAGEVIDIDAFTGGYNLQIAFSTGFAAGSEI